MATSCFVFHINICENTKITIFRLTFENKLTIYKLKK